MEEYKLKDYITEEESQFAPKYDIEDEIKTISELKESLPENRYKAPTDMSPKNNEPCVAQSIATPRITIINDESDFSALSQKQKMWLEKIESIKHDELLESIKQPKVAFGHPKVAFGQPKVAFGHPKVAFGHPMVDSEPPKTSNESESVGTDEQKNKLVFEEPLKKEEPIVQEAVETEKKIPIIPPFKADAPFAKTQDENVEVVNKQALPPPVVIAVKEKAEEAVRDTAVKEREPLVPPRRLKRLSADEILAMHKMDIAEKRFDPAGITVSGGEQSDGKAVTEMDEDITNAEKLAQLYYASEEEEYSE